MRFAERIHRLLLLRFAGVVALSMGCATLVNLSRTEALEEQRWVVQTYDVLVATERFGTLLRDAEIGQRNFLLTGEACDLGLYRAAIAHLARGIEDLTELTRDNSRQTARIAQLRDLVEQRLVELQEPISLLSRRSPESPRTVLRTDRGRELMQRIRSLIADLRGEEETLLKGRRTRAGIAAQAFGVVSWGGAVLNLLLLALAYRQVSQELSRRAAVEERLRASEARQTELAMKDALTGLANRRQADEQLVASLALADRTGSALSVILLDVDHFKRFNDEFGHPAGDETLRTVAKALLSGTRASDVVCRYGGEEFLVIAPGADEAGALVLAERLRLAVSRREWPRRAITVSLGVSTRSQRKTDPAALVMEADQALYRSKHRGRDCATHYAQHGDLAG